MPQFDDLPSLEFSVVGDKIDTLHNSGRGLTQHVYSAPLG